MKNSLSGLKVLIIALVLLLLTSSGVLADFTLPDWRYYRDINLPAGLQSEGLVELLPDAAVFSGAQNDLADIRIITGGGVETPYKLEVSQAERVRTSLPVSVRDRGYVPGNYDIFTADLGQSGLLHNEIEIETASGDFRRRATVESSHDGATWMRIAEQVIYAFTVKERHFTTRDTRVRYTPSTARYLRVQVFDDGGGSLRITGATVSFAKDTPAREVAWPSSILSTSRDVDHGTTTVEIDLGTPGLPSYRLAIGVAEVNFYREVDVQTSTDRQKWATVTPQADIYAFDTPKFVGERLSITYPETTDRYLRLVIQDQDSPPLTVREINVWGLWRRLVFTADPQQSYQLYYGNSAARRPSYDIERVFNYLITDKLPQAGIGPQVANTHFVEKKPPVSERYPWLLPVVVAIAAVMVAILLIGVFRQARKVLPPPQP